jgi:aminodeoxyfutalosine deaminase
MRYFSADCIIPVSGEPCYNSVLVITDKGVIEGIYKKNELRNRITEIMYFKGILCPGFVNTHCHLELSYAEGLIPKGQSLDTFVRKLEILKKVAAGEFILYAIKKAASDMQNSGIVATVDITNGDATSLFKRRSKQYFHTFVEVFGSNPASAKEILGKAECLKTHFERNQKKGGISLTPHATYSLSNDLFELVASASHGSLLSIHHQENNDENLFFKDGSGPIASRRKAFNPDLPDFPGTGKRPMESVAGHFEHSQKLLLVHNTFTEQQDIDFVENYFSDAYWCFCPNANLYIEKKLPDINLFRSNGCKITLGTDSLASNHQLSILEEMKTIQQHFPEIPLPELVNWATLNGATFLGLGNTLGSFEKGKKPGVVLIENADSQTLKLSPNSTSQLIIPAGL